EARRTEGRGRPRAPPRGGGAAGRPRPARAVPAVWLRLGDRRQRVDRGRAVGEAGARAPRRRSRLELTNRVLIVGGGPAGMSAALALARRGIESLVAE